MNKYTFSTQSGKAYYCNSIPGFIKDTSHNIVEISGKKFSSSNVVKINIEAQDNVSTPNIMKMFLVNENQYSTLRNQDIVWIDFSSTVNWTLTPGESRRRVYIIIKDAAGNQSTYAAE